MYKRQPYKEGLVFKREQWDQISKGGREGVKDSCDESQTKKVTPLLLRSVILITLLFLKNAFQ